MKQIFLLILAMIFVLVCFEMLLQVNYYVLVGFNKFNNKEFVVKESKYKLKTVELYLKFNDSIKNKAEKFIEQNV